MNYHELTIQATHTHTHTHTCAHTHMYTHARTRTHSHSHTHTLTHTHTQTHTHMQWDERATPQHGARDWARALCSWPHTWEAKKEKEVCVVCVDVVAVYRGLLPPIECRLCGWCSGWTKACCHQLSVVCVDGVAVEPRSVATNWERDEHLGGGSFPDLYSATYCDGSDRRSEIAWRVT